MKPHLAFTVENKLSDEPDAPKLGVDLNFRSMDDFSPDAVARQVKPLRELLELRTQLADLRGSLQTNDKLDEVLQATLGDAAKMDKLKAELGLGGEGPMAEAQTARGRPRRTPRREGSLLDQIVDEGRLGRDADAKARGKDLVKQFVAQVLEGSITVARDTEAMINARIAQIDHLLSLQINEIVHHPEFQRWSRAGAGSST
jgi:hypothetical protein